MTDQSKLMLTPHGRASLEARVREIGIHVLSDVADQYAAQCKALDTAAGQRETRKLMAAERIRAQAGSTVEGAALAAVGRGAGRSWPGDRDTGPHAMARAAWNRRDQRLQSGPATGADDG